MIGEITTGASNDLQKVTNIAYIIVTKLGMSSLGLLTFKDGGYIKPFSQSYENVSF